MKKFIKKIVTAFKLIFKFKSKKTIKETPEESIINDNIKRLIYTKRTDE